MQLRGDILEGSEQPSNDPDREFSRYYDEDWGGYPPTLPERLLDWRDFNVNVYSENLEAGTLPEELDTYHGQVFDLRPYMIEEPIKIQRHTRLSKALELFNTYHIRHLLVVNAVDCSIAGMVTRKDLDAYMSYEKAGYSEYMVADI